MNIRYVEYAIIGTGTAGLGAYSRIRRQSDSLVLIEQGPYGTTCARVGCMPSKMLITAADHAYDTAQGALFGINAAPEIDDKYVLNRVRKDRAEKFVGNVLKQIGQIPSHLKIQGSAKFISDKQIQIDDDLIIEAQKVIIACGTRPFIPVQLQSIANNIYTSDSIFEIETLPKSIAVIGLGVIALELGQAMHRLGVKTHLFGRSGKVGGLTHPQMQDQTLTCLSDELTIYPQGEIVSACEENQSIKLCYQVADGQIIEQHFDAVLVAAGRVSNVDKLGLHNTQIPIDDKGVPKFDSLSMQCSDLPVYIAGDATSELPLWHEAYDEGRAAGDSALHYPVAKQMRRKTPLGIYFTDPQMAVVGRSFEQLQGVDIVIGEADFNGPRHLVWQKIQGRMQVYLDAHSGEILGAELLGFQAEHLAHLLALAITHKMSAEQMLEMPIYHPSAEEVLKKALDNARFQLT